MTRQEITEKLSELPNRFIEKAYGLDVLRGTLQLQYDPFLKSLYRAERIADNPLEPEFIFFQIGSWKITMETKGD